MSLSAQIRSNALADPKLLSDILSEKTDRRIDILRRIADVGSISEAARSAGMSYKSAWQAVETLTNLAGTPIVEKVVGGANGGGTQLTATGRLILDLSDELARARRQVPFFAPRMLPSTSPSARKVQRRRRNGPWTSCTRYCELPADLHAQSVSCPHHGHETRRGIGTAHFAD